MGRARCFEETQQWVEIPRVSVAVFAEERYPQLFDASLPLQMAAVSMVCFVEATPTAKHGRGECILSRPYGVSVYRYLGTQVAMVYKESWRVNYKSHTSILNARCAVRPPAVVMVFRIVYCVPDVPPDNQIVVVVVVLVFVTSVRPAGILHVDVAMVSPVTNQAYVPQSKV